MRNRNPGSNKGERALSLWIAEEDRPTRKEAIEVARQKGISFTQLMWDAAREYLERHRADVQA